MVNLSSQWQRSMRLTNTPVQGIFHHRTMHLRLQMLERIPCQYFSGPHSQQQQRNRHLRCYSHLEHTSCDLPNPMSANLVVLQLLRNCWSSKYSCRCSIASMSATGWCPDNGKRRCLRRKQNPRHRTAARQSELKDAW